MSVQMSEMRNIANLSINSEGMKGKNILFTFLSAGNIQFKRWGYLQRV